MKQLFIFIASIFLFSCDKSSSNEANFSGTSGKGGSMARFTIVGNYLYTVDKQDLKVFDITSPFTPVFKRSIPVGFEIETIFPFKDKLFIGSTSVVHIFSIDDPANPQKLSVAISQTVMRRCDPVVAKDTVAYATLRTNGECGGVASILAVYDIKDIKNPVQRASRPVTEPYGLGYSGNTLYVCDKQQGIMIFDITKAFDPVLVGKVANTTGYFIDVIPYGSILICWASNGMTLYDISSPQTPTLIKHIP